MRTFSFVREFHDAPDILKWNQIVYDIELTNNIFKRNFKSSGTNLEFSKVFECDLKSLQK